MNGSADILLERLAEYNHASCMIYGIGNDGREDDGLGWAFIDWLEQSGVCKNAETHRSYQLMYEDSDLIRNKDRVLFVDATKAVDVEAIKLETVTDQMDTSFTSHALSIPMVMAVCKTCFERVPDVQLLTIRGYVWELKIGLSPQAARNLEVAKEFFSKGGL